jgi:hypothetical protein
MKEILRGIKLQLTTEDPSLDGISDGERNDLSNDEANICWEATDVAHAEDQHLPLSTVASASIFSSEHARATGRDSTTILAGKVAHHSHMRIRDIGHGRGSRILDRPQTHQRPRR